MRTKRSNEERVFRLLLSWGCREFLPKGSTIVVPDKDGERKEYNSGDFYITFSIGHNPFVRTSKEIGMESADDLDALVERFRTILKESDDSHRNSKTINDEIKALEERLEQLKQEKQSKVNTRLF